MINHNTAMFYAFIKLLAGITGRGIPVVIFILETGGLGLPPGQELDSWQQLFIPFRWAPRIWPPRATRRAANMYYFV